MKRQRLLLCMVTLWALALLACNGDQGSGQPAAVTTSPSPGWSPEAGATPGAQTADISLAYMRDDATRLFIRRHVLDARAGEEQEIPLPEGCGQVADLALAPGAAKLALACQSSERWPVYIVDLSRLDHVKVAQQWGGGLRWSPDGLTLAYGVGTVVEERAPSEAVGIHLVSNDGADDRGFLPPRIWQAAGPWAPDGKSILVTTCVTVEQLQGQVLITEQHWLEDEQEPRVVAEGVTPVDWSLRAGAVLGQHDWCPGGSQRPTPWVVELPFGNSYAIAPPNLIPVGWLDSGDKAVLYFMRSPQTVAGEIWLADRAGQWQLERVLVVPDGINDLALAPDRRSILYTDSSGALYAWDTLERGEPRLIGRGAPANLSAAIDHSAD